MSNRLDLHIHSQASDGADSIPDLLRKIQRSDIHTFAITDHDTLEGSDQMKTLVPDALHFIRGIEFTCITPNRKCHILGYGFDPLDSNFQHALTLVKNLRQEKKRLRIDFLKNELGIELTKDELTWLTQQVSPGKPNFAEIVVKHGLAPDIDTAIAQYINKCKTPREGIDAQIAIQAILKSGGIPVWAHPLGGEGERRLTTDEFHTQLTTLIEYGIQGLECYYSRYSQKESAFLLSEAQSHDLLVSAGSDYHGSNKKNLDLGQLNTENVMIHPDQVTLLKELKSDVKQLPSR